MQKDTRSEAIAQVVDEARRYSQELDRMEREDRKDGLKGTLILIAIFGLILGVYLLVRFLLR